MEELDSLYLKIVKNYFAESREKIFFETMIKTQQDAEELIETINSVKTGANTDIERSLIEFAISNSYHKVKRYDLASKHLQLANKYKLLAFPSNVQARLQEIADNLTHCHYQQKAPADMESGKGRIFIVGMPRSGSTILESILSMNPESKALGESSALKIAIARFKEP